MNLSTRIRVRESSTAPLLSFMIPLIIRVIPELQFPYPIGFDTAEYLASAKLYSIKMQIFPLFFQLLGWLYLLGIDPIISMKILPTLLYGILGLSVYIFARYYLRWNNLISLLSCILFSISLASLRVSWDLNKETFATIFLILSLSMLGNLRSWNRGIILIAFSLIVASSHELIFALMFFILLYVALIELRRMNGSNRIKVIALLISIVSSTFLFLIFWYRLNFSYILGSALKFSVLAQNTSPTLQSLGLIFLLLYGTSIPFILLGFFKDTVLNAWLIAGLVGSFSWLFFPLVSVNLPDRWMYLLSFPFSLYLSNSIAKLFHFIKVRKFIVVLIVIGINFLSLSELGLFAWPQWVPNANGYIPYSMSTSSIPQYDIVAIKGLVDTLDGIDGSKVVITQLGYSGWVRYYSKSSFMVIAWVPWQGDLNGIGQALSLANSIPNAKIYLIWYADKDAIQLGFTKIAQVYNMKLYEYGVLS